MQQMHIESTRRNLLEGIDNGDDGDNGPIMPTGKHAMWGPVQSKPLRGLLPGSDRHLDITGGKYDADAGKRKQKGDGQKYTKRHSGLIVAPVEDAVS